MKSSTVLGVREPISFLRSFELIRLRGQLRLKSLLRFNFGSCFRGALFSSKLPLIHLLVIKDIIKVLDQLLLAADTIDFSSRYHIEDIIDVVTVDMLIFS